ncbi:sensor histidine kinase [Arthrobacter sp. Sr24]
MSETLAEKLVGRFFYQRSLRVRVILSQLPFFLTVALAAILIAWTTPVLPHNPQLIAGLWLTTGLTVACFAVPWDRLPRPSFLIIPYLDFIAVGLFREGIQSHLSSAGILALFPVYWLCASGYAPKVAIFSSTLATLLIAWNPILQSEQVSGDALLRPLLFPFMMFGFAITVVILTTSMDRQRIALVGKDAQLRAALQESQYRERLLETVVDTVGVGVLAVDVDGKGQLMNTTQATIHALSLPSHISDPEEKDLLLFSSEKVPLAPQARPVQRAVNGESFTNYQIWVGEGENSRAISATARVIPSEANASVGSVIAFHDVTDMVNALAAKDDLLANVSHEFRTPLTSIQSYIALALESLASDPENATLYLHIAERNAERMGNLVSDLLTTAAMSVERVPCNMSQLLSDSASSVAPAAEANAVKVVQHCDDPLMAMVDGARIGQVLDNLVSNAVKYSPDGGTLTLRAWANGTDLHCEVSDTGLGMSSVERGRLFQKFFRAGTAVKRGIPGIGLGLMISRAILDSHGGSLTLVSDPGSGTTVSFVIPACVVTP